MVMRCDIQVGKMNRHIQAHTYFKMTLGGLKGMTQDHGPSRGQHCAL
jgi:hypothetical protein